MAKITIYSLTLVDMILFRYRYEHYLKKASKKNAKNAHNRCLYLQTYENELAKSMKPCI